MCHHSFLASKYQYFYKAEMIEAKSANCQVEDEQKSQYGSD